jgi:hypothetical protein
MGQLFAWVAHGRGLPNLGECWAELSCALQGASHFWKASCRESHAVLPDSFAHRGREVHWRPSWALMEGVVLSRDSD